jgi:hypothetical protein
MHRSIELRGESTPVTSAFAFDLNFFRARADNGASAPLFSPRRVVQIGVHHGDLFRFAHLLQHGQHAFGIRFGGQRRSGGK